MQLSGVNEQSSQIVWVSPAGDAVVEVFNGYFHVNKKYIPLTNNELRLLTFIVSGKGAVRTKSMILIELYEQQRQAEQKIIDIFVCKIRKKLGQDAAGMVRTIWGRGYALATHSEDTNIHWVPAVKAAIIESITLGEKSVETVLQEHPGLSADELSEWQASWTKDRQAGLRVTRTQDYQKICS